MTNSEDETLLVFISVLSPHRGPVSAVKWFSHCSFCIPRARNCRHVRKKPILLEVQDLNACEI